MFMKAQVNFFAGHHNRGERDAALANLGDLPAGAALSAREVTRDHPPAVEFEGGVLRLSGLWWFEELDVLLMDYGSPEVYPLVTRGRIDGGEFQCSPIASLRLRAAPEPTFLVRLVSQAQEVVYMRVTTAQVGVGPPVCTIWPA